MPQGIRKILFWMHLSAGVVAGIVIFIMCVTGVLLAFQRQITEFADRRHTAPVTIAGSNALPLEEILTKLNTETGSSPSGITVYAKPERPYMAEFGRERVLFVDPHTGAVLGEGSQAVRRFFRVVTDWHRWLDFSQESRPVGRAITGASNLIFLFIVLSGPCLWLPRRWSWSNVKSVLWFRGGLRGKARDFNWHSVSGIWCAIPLAIVVATAVVMSYGWANNALYLLTGTQPPSAQQGGAEGRRPEGTQPQGPKKPVSFAGLDGPLAHAKQQDASWKAITMRLPARDTVSYTIVTGYEGRPDRRAQLVLKRDTAEVVRWEPFSSNNAGRRLRMWFRFLHTGEAGGLAGQLIGAVACAAGALLVYTGIALSLRRFGAWKRRRTSQDELQPEEPVTA